MKVGEASRQANVVVKEELDATGNQNDQPVRHEDADLRQRPARDRCLSPPGHHKADSRSQDADLKHRTPRDRCIPTDHRHADLTQRTPRDRCVLPDLNHADLTQRTPRDRCVLPDLNHADLIQRIPRDKCISPDLNHADLRQRTPRDRCISPARKHTDLRRRSSRDRCILPDLNHADLRHKIPRDRRTSPDHHHADLRPRTPRNRSTSPSHHHADLSNRTPRDKCASRDHQADLRHRTPRNRSISPGHHHADSKNTTPRDRCASRDHHDAELRRKSPRRNFVSQERREGYRYPDSPIRSHRKESLDSDVRHESQRYSDDGTGHREDDLDSARKRRKKSASVFRERPCEAETRPLHQREDRKGDGYFSRDRYPDSPIRSHRKESLDSDVRHESQRYSDDGTGHREDDLDSARKRRKKSASVFRERPCEAETRPLHQREDRKGDGYFSRDRYDKSRQMPAGREDRHVWKDEKDDLRRRLLTTPVQTNGKGEPQGVFENVVTYQLTSVVRKHVPIQTMWSAVSVEVKYEICQELQGMFNDGARIDASWIKAKARKLHASARDRAKSELWRRECLSGGRRM